MDLQILLSCPAKRLLGRGI